MLMSSAREASEETVLSPTLGRSLFGSDLVLYGNTGNQSLSQVNVALKSQKDPFSWNVETPHFNV